MSKRKFYTVEVEWDEQWTTRHEESKKIWHPILMATGISLEYAKGYLARENENYPSRHIRIVDHFSGEVIVDTAANGSLKVSANSSKGIAELGIKDGKAVNRLR